MIIKVQYNFAKKLLYVYHKELSEVDSSERVLSIDAGMVILIGGLLSVSVLLGVPGVCGVVAIGAYMGEGRGLEKSLIDTGCCKCARLSGPGRSDTLSIQMPLSSKSDGKDKDEMEPLDFRLPFPGFGLQVQIKELYNHYTYVYVCKHQRKIKFLND